MKPSNDFISFDGQLNRRLLYILVGVLLPLILAFNVQLNAPVVDSFHEGEYLGSIESMQQFFAGLAAFPVLVHGAMDYLPAMLASRHGTGDNIIVMTRLFNVATVALCWVVWLDLARLALRKHQNALAWYFLFIILFLMMAGATGSDPVRKQQAFIGTRDAFLILSVWTGFQASKLLGPKALLSALGCGMFAGMSLYWSYDRGIIAMVWIAILALGMALRGARTSPLLLIVSYLTTLWLVSILGIVGSLSENLYNIHYWLVNTADVWHMPIKYKAIALPSAIAMAIFALCVCFNAWRIAMHEQRTLLLPTVAGLTAVQLVFLTKLYALPGFPASYYFIWPSVLMLVLVPPTSPALAVFEESLRRLSMTLWSSKGIGGLPWTRICALALVGIFFFNHLMSSALTSLNVLQPKPDRELLSAAHYGLKEFDSGAAPCIFQWSNEGVFAFAAKKTHCLRFTYAVYISRTQELAALQELRSNPPRLIVYDAPNWSMKIYGRHMRERLPLIDQFINEYYEFHRTTSGYVFATPKTIAPNSSRS